MKKLKKNRMSGITLIALVVAIIVLLILAGISISMLSGDNGVLQKAIDAKTKSDEAQIRERIQLAYHSSLTKDITSENGELTMPTLQAELDNEFAGKTVTIIPSADKKEWTIEVDGVKVTVVANGRNNPDSNTNPLASDTLEEGDYVIYNNITCRVLYGPSSDYGIELISDESVDIVYLGSSDTNENVTASAFNTEGITYTGTISDEAKKAATSYNRAIYTLNEKAQSYVVEGDRIVDKTKTRCVGSDPASPEDITTTDYAVTSSATNKYIRTYGYNNKFKVADTSNCYLTDYNKMSNLNIHNINGTYWLASRFMMIYSRVTYFRVRYVNVYGYADDGSENLFNVYSDGYLGKGGTSYGFRPVFHLQSGVKVVIDDDHDGSTSEKAYTLLASD